MAAPADIPVLWHLEISHYNEKVRWALDHKGVAHVRRAVTPALQELTARRMGTGRTLPILKMNGRVIGDSARIIEAIERQWPQPPLYPAGEEERRRALELQAAFDECGDHVRRVLFADMMAEPQKFLTMLYGRAHPLGSLLRIVSPAFCRLVSRRFRIRPDTVERSRERVLAGFDEVEARIGASGYLAGDAFSVADLTAASILSLVVVPPEFPYVKLHPDDRSAQFRRFRDSLKDRPGFAWVQDMYRRHRGTSAEVTAAPIQRLATKRSCT